MTTEKQQLQVNGISVEVVRKDIKNLHLAVYPPNGRVRVAVPSRTTDETVRLAVISRLGWIRRQQDELHQQERQSMREMVTGESHFFWGRRYRLSVIEHAGPGTVIIKNGRTIEMRCPALWSRDQRVGLMSRWYRSAIREQIPGLLSTWSPIVGVEVPQCGIKRMKTRWGTCNIDAKRIWLNLELAKKPSDCLEYILVHEMVHLLERHHNDRFRLLMDQLMPQWRQFRDQLNRAPLAHEEWDY